VVETGVAVVVAAAEVIAIAGKSFLEQ